MRNDEYWIRRCFALAKKGVGATSPNPLVGAVIVKHDRIIAEGFHKKYGGPHAEINAINSAIRKRHDLSDATIYVNLEPCFHLGNTPPCVDEIIKHRFSRVVISSLDPNPLVAGKSVAKLKENGISCLIGVSEKEAKYLNEKFFKYITSGIPFISLKAAQTLDGFIARSDGSSRWISNARSRIYAHRLRGQYDAVLVGAETVIKDDPQLTVRSVKGRNPLRVVLDGNLRAPLRSKIFNSSAPTVVYTSGKSSQKKIHLLEKNNVAVVTVPGRNGRISLREVVEDLARHQIISILVEGGQQMYAQFLNARLADKVYLFTARKKFKAGISTFSRITKEIKLRRETSKNIGTDVLEEFYIT